jgi:hypothetical protein
MTHRKPNEDMQQSDAFSPYRSGRSRHTQAGGRFARGAVIRR